MTEQDREYFISAEEMEALRTIARWGRHIQDAIDINGAWVHMIPAVVAVAEAVKTLEPHLHDDLRRRVPLEIPDDLSEA